MSDRVLTARDASNIIYGEWRDQLLTVETHLLFDGKLNILITPKNAAIFAFRLDNCDWDWMSAEGFIAEVAPHMSSLGWIPSKWLLRAMEQHV